MNNKFILASSSRKKINLLKKIGFDNLVSISSNLSDISPYHKEKPTQYIKRIATQKIESLVNSLDEPEQFILSSKSIIISRAQIIENISNPLQAKNTLTSLSNHRHKVKTAVSLYNPYSQKVITKISTTIVQFRLINANEIEQYIQSNEWYNQLGGYKINGFIACFIKQIIGEYSNLEGLPLSLTYNLLKGNGLQILS